MQVTAFVRRHASVLAVLLVASISAGTIAAVIWEARIRDRQVAESLERDEAAAVERRGQICRAIMDNRTALLELTNVVLAGEGNGLPLTRLPQFEQLEPRTREYVQALADAQTEGEGLRERIDAFRTGLLAAPLPDFCQET